MPLLPAQRYRTNDHRTVLHGILRTLRIGALGQIARRPNPALG